MGTMEICGLYNRWSTDDDRYLLGVGKCNDSVPECVSKTKIVVDNIPKGLLRFNTPFGASRFKGLIPSIGEDMISLKYKPIDWEKRSSNKCIKRTASVGHSNRFTNVEFCGPNMGGGGRSCVSLEQNTNNTTNFTFSVFFFSR